MDKTTEVYKRVARLVPCELVRVSISKNPKARRFPMGLDWTHRGCALLFCDDEVSLEAEATKDMVGVKGRFPKRVRVGIFWYGTALKDLEELPEEAEGDTPVYEPSRGMAPARFGSRASRSGTSHRRCAARWLGSTSTSIIHRGLTWSGWSS